MSEPDLKLYKVTSVQYGYVLASSPEAARGLAFCIRTWEMPAETVEEVKPGAVQESGWGERSLVYHAPADTGRPADVRLVDVWPVGGG